MMYMLDTNICIYIIKSKPKNVIEKFRTFRPSDICMSSVTFAELEYGVAKSRAIERNRDALAMFVAPLEILPFEGTAAEAYGSIRAGLETSGQVIGSMDMLIAAHSIAVNAVLVTNNVKEFERVKGLRVENWV
ncbi:type II toxin-antitoxin system VapC family toxin [Seleniivibrio sp.]|uniref:type II toxin-antitoxin system tRNA(fMet)-specific endonuclease VapC n=1 Tax=Seleniivibrio sp. TaxID=2898801 RepID=UPI00344918E1